MGEVEDLEELKKGKDRNWPSIRWIWESTFGITILSLFFSFLIISLMALMCGVQPWTVVISIFEGGLKGKPAIEATIKEMVPLALASLAVFLPFQAGFFNIGGQGQIQLGAIVAMAVVLNFKGNPFIGILLALLAAAAAGIAAAIIPLVLKITRDASEVTIGIMINFACIHFVYAMITGVMKNPESWYGTTHLVPDQFRLPVINIGVNVHLGTLITLLLVVVVFWLMRRTTYGIKVSAVGFKPTVAEAAGISLNKVIAMAVLGGAALAGLAGGIQALGVSFKVAEGWAKDWGFNGIPIAFLAGNNVLAVIPISILFAILETGARYMQAMTGVPAALVYVFQGLPVLFYVALNARRILSHHPKREI